MRTNVLLKYQGPALDDGSMDVYEASANMIAFSEFMVAVVKTTYGETAEAKAEVSGFARGSFVTQLAFDVAGATASVFADVSPLQIWTVVKDAFTIWKHLKGQPPQAIAQTDGGQHVSVENNSGNVIQVRTESLTLVLSDRGANSVSRFVRQALSTDGVTSLAIEHEDGAPLVSVGSGRRSVF